MRDQYNMLRQQFINSFIIVGSLLFFASCSSESYTQQDETTKKKGEQTLYFSKNEDGHAIHYEANFNNGEITSLYKNGIKVSQDSIKNYGDLVYDNLNSIKRKDNDNFAFHGPKIFHFDMHSLNNNMKEWRKKFKDEDFSFKFDHKKFKEDIDKLKDELKGCDDIVIHIDKDKIRKDIDEGLKDLDELKMHNFNFDFNEDELNKNLKSITIEIEKNKNNLELNMEDLKDQMDDLKDKMGDLSDEMDNLDKEMKNLNSFLAAVKVELVKDGLIKSSDEEFEMELSPSKMKVNDEKVADNLLEKYKTLYKKYFDKEIEGKIKFEN